MKSRRQTERLIDSDLFERRVYAAVSRKTGVSEAHVPDFLGTVGRMDKRLRRRRGEKNIDDAIALAQEFDTEYSPEAGDWARRAGVLARFDKGDIDGARRIGEQFHGDTFGETASTLLEKGYDSEEVQRWAEGVILSSADGPQAARRVQALNYAVLRRQLRAS
jgi:hypothetical protein